MTSTADPAPMAVVLAYRLKPYKSGFFDLPYKTRLQIYRYSLIDHDHNTIPIFRTTVCASDGDHFALSPRSLCAQLLLVCHQLLDEASLILYTENNFTLYIDENVVRPRAIPVSITGGNISKLQRITISIHSVQLLRQDLSNLLSSLPSLQTLGIDGNLLRTIHLHRSLGNGLAIAMQRCIGQSLGLFLSAFAGKEHFHKFMDRRPGLVIEYTFGAAVDVILPATGEFVKGKPWVSFMVD